MNSNRFARIGMVLTLSLALAANLWSAPPAWAATTYTWTGATDTDWQVATNWSPNRNTPAADDVLQFNGGGTSTVTNVAAETIGQLLVSNNTTVNLQVPAARTLTIGGGTGTDLDVCAGCSLNSNSTFALTIFLAGGATGSVSGSMTFSSAAHRLNAQDANAITFNSGATFTQGALCTGNVFGNSGTANVIVFASGSTFVHQAGANPFGLAQPNSKVIFESGSLYRYENTAGTGAAFSGRTYANFEMNASGTTVSGTGGSPLSMDNLTVTAGTLNLGMTGGFNLKGNISVAAGTTLNFNPASAATVTLNGSSAQTISGAGTLIFQANQNVTVDNANGVAIQNDFTINGVLTLTNGLVTLGDNNLTLGTAATVGGTPSASNMIVTNGLGSLWKLFSGVGSFTFPIGDNTGTAEYSPATLNFISGTFASGAYAGVQVVNSKHPLNASTTDYIDRFWTVDSGFITDLRCDVTFQYVPTDVHGTEANIYGAEWNWSFWRQLNPADTVNHQLTGRVASFSQFTGGEESPTAVTLAAFAAAPSGADILLEWETALELDSAGFNIYRSDALDGEYVRLNGALIPPRNHSGVYTWTDDNVQPGATYYYKLESVGLQGASAFYGPVSAVSLRLYRIYMPLVLTP